MKTALAAFVSGLAVWALMSSGVAQDPGPVVTGGYLSHRTEERIDISVGVTRAGDPRREERHVEFRDTVNVPRHFGTPFAVTQHQQFSIVWYRDSEGVVRNVAVQGASGRQLQIETVDSSLRESNKRPY